MSRRPSRSRARAGSRLARSPIAIVSAAFVACVVGGAVLWLRFLDVEPPDDADLIVGPLPRVSGGENGLLLLRFARDEVWWDRKNPDHRALRKGSGWSDEAVVTLLVRNAEPLARLERALAMPEFALQGEGGADPFWPSTLLWQPVCEWIELARVVGVRARARCRDGDREGALDDVVLLHHFARRIERGARAMLPQIAAMITRSIAHDTLGEILAGAPLDPRPVRVALAKIAALAPDVRHFTAALRAEYTSLTRVIDDVAVAEPAVIVEEFGARSPTLARLATTTFRPNLVRSRLAAYFRTAIEQLESGDLETTIPGPDRGGFEGIAGVLDRYGAILMDSAHLDSFRSRLLRQREEFRQTLAALGGVCDRSDPDADLP